jgi:hypothetical protein
MIKKETEGPKPHLSNDYYVIGDFNQPRQALCNGRILSSMRGKSGACGLNSVASIMAMDFCVCTVEQQHVDALYHSLYTRICKVDARNMRGSGRILMSALSFHWNTKMGDGF